MVSAGPNGWFRARVCSGWLSDACDRPQDGALFTVLSQGVTVIATFRSHRGAMTTQNPSRHHRHLIELASILATAGLADAFADVFGMRRHGAGALVGLGVALVVATVGHHIWLRRTDHAPPAAFGGPIRPPGRTSPARAALSAAAAGAAAGSDDAGVPAAASAVWRVRTEIDDSPGRLAVFAGALAAAGANIHALEAHPTPVGVVDEFLVEASPHTTAEQLCAAVRAVGGRAAHAARADMLALMDAPTRVLELAGRLARRSASPASILAELLGAHSVLIGAGPINNGPGEHGVEPPGSLVADGGADGTRYRFGADGTTLCLRRPDGAVVTVARPGMPFTTTELARARAMLDLEACLEAGLRGRVRLDRATPDPEPVVDRIAP